MPDRVLDDPVVGEVAAEQTDAAGPVGLVGHPDEAVGAHAKQLGAVVVTMLDAQAEPRRRPPDPAAGNVQSMLFRPLPNLLQCALALREKAFLHCGVCHYISFWLPDLDIAPFVRRLINDAE